MAKGNSKTHRFSIQLQLISISILFSLIIALAVWCSSIYMVHTSSRRSILQSAEYGLQIAANNISKNVQEIDDFANWCSVNSTFKTYYFGNLTPDLLPSRVYQAAYNKYLSLTTQRYVQRFLLYKGSFPILQFGNSSNFSRVLNNQNITGLPDIAREESTGWEKIVNDPLLLTAPTAGIPITRVVDNAKSKDARVYITVSSAILTDSLRSYNLPEGDELFFIMSENLYRVERDYSLTLLGPTDDFSVDLEETADTLDERTNVYNITTKDGPAMVVMYPLGQHNMYLAQSIPMVSVLQQMPTLQTPALLTLCAIVLLGGVLALLLRRMVAKPIRSLQRQLATIADGTFTTDDTIEWNNELGDIGRGINSLSRSVTALMDKRLEDEKQKQDLEYRMLQNQINPHFIYNTLNSIKWMATIQHAPGIAEMVTALSRLLKSVSKSTARLVPLYEEFALLNDYFTIQQYRYGGTIMMDVCYIEDERFCRDCMIPRFTLQPLVENAIFHGIEPKGCAGNIDLTVRQDHETGDVLVELKDDGVGMTTEQVDKALREPDREEKAIKFRHVGIWNVHKRLQYNFGPAYGLSLTSVPDEGTTVTVRLPYSPAQKPKDKEGAQNDDRTLS